MSTTLKIIIEIILALVTLFLSINFWQCVKSPRFMGKMLLERDRIKALNDYLITKINISEIKAPELGFDTTIILWIKTSIKTLDKVRNQLFIVLILVIIGSFLLGYMYFLIILCIFLITSFSPMTNAASNNIYNDILTVMDQVYHWNKSNPIECREFCTKKQPRMLKCIYEVINEN